MVGGEYTERCGVSDRRQHKNIVTSTSENSFLLLVLMLMCVIGPGADHQQRYFTIRQLLRGLIHSAVFLRSLGRQQQEVIAFTQDRNADVRKFVIDFIEDAW